MYDFNLFFFIFFFIYFFFFFFFFSSRRRHTRSYGDWSSDVCAPDLDAARAEPRAPRAPAPPRAGTAAARARGRADRRPAGAALALALHRPLVPARRLPDQIGRASCMERVESAVGAGAVKKKSEKSAD